MQIVKTVVLGLLFWFFGTLVYLGFVLPRRPGLGIGLGAIKFHLMNPIYWLLIVLAFGAAFWLVRVLHRA